MKGTSCVRRCDDGKSFRKGIGDLLCVLQQWLTMLKCVVLMGSLMKEVVADRIGMAA